MILLLSLSLVQAWQFVAPMPTPRYGFGMGVVGNKVYVIGGRNSTTILDVVEAYDPISNSWDSNFVPLPTARCFAGCAVYDNKIYIIGGMKSLTGSFNNTSLVERFDPVSNNWDTVSSLPDAKDALGAGTYENKIYAIGGFQWVDSIGYYKRTVECYDPILNSWQEVDSLNTPRINLGVTIFNNRIYALGGSYFSSLSSVEYYISDYWSYGIPMTIDRGGPGVASYVNDLYVIGGDNNGAILNSVGIFKDSIWLDGPTLNQARAYFGVAIVGDSIFAIGGKGASGVLNTNELHSLPLLGIEETKTDELTTEPPFPTIFSHGAEFELEPGDKLLVHNSIGRLVGEMNKRARLNLPAGVYFIRLLKKDGSVKTHKIIIVK